MTRNSGPKKTNEKSADLEIHIDSLELLNNEIAGRLARQDSNGSRVETKATVIAGFAATAAQLLIARHPAHPAFAVAAIVAYGLALASAVTSLRISTYQDLTPRALLDEYALEGKGALLATLAATRVTAFEHNELIHKRKTRWWWIGLWTLLAGIVFSALSLVQTGVHA